MELKKAKPLLQQRADPWVYLHTNGLYYFTASVPEYDRIELRCAKNLRGLDGAETKVIWQKHERGEQSANIWAPEIHNINGSWYIYYAAARTAETDEGLYDHRIYVIENISPDPMKGEWKECGQLKTHMETFCLDATVWKHRNRHYLLWPQKDSAIEGNSNLYIAEMDSPLHLKSKPIMISKPEFPWEKIGFLVNEGPACIAHEDRIFLTYSASATDFNYCIGLLYASIDADILNPKSWKKLDHPILSTREDERIFGPGHSCFTKSENGEDLLVFHARNYKEIQGDPLYDPNRHTYIYRISWDEENFPCFKIV